MAHKRGAMQHGALRQVAPDSFRACHLAQRQAARAYGRRQPPTAAALHGVYMRVSPRCGFFGRGNALLREPELYFQFSRTRKLLLRGGVTCAQLSHKHFERSDSFGGRKHPSRF